MEKTFGASGGLQHQRREDCEAPEPDALPSAFPRETPRMVSWVNLSRVQVAREGASLQVVQPDPEEERPGRSHPAPSVTGCVPRTTKTAFL